MQNKKYSPQKHIEALQNKLGGIISMRLLTPIDISHFDVVRSINFNWAMILASTDCQNPLARQFSARLDNQYGLTAPAPAPAQALDVWHKSCINCIPRKGLPA